MDRFRCNGAKPTTTTCGPQPRSTINDAARPRPADDCVRSVPPYSDTLAIECSDRPEVFREGTYPLGNIVRSAQSVHKVVDNRRGNVLFICPPNN